MVGLDGGEILDHLQHIGVVAQKVLGFLGGGVGDLRKGPEGGDIEKALAIEPAQIMGVRHTGDGGGRQSGQIAQGQV